MPEILFTKETNKKEPPPTKNPKKRTRNSCVPPHLFFTKISKDLSDLSSHQLSSSTPIHRLSFPFQYLHSTLFSCRDKKKFFLLSDQIKKSAGEMFYLVFCLSSFQIKIQFPLAFDHISFPHPFRSFACSMSATPLLNLMSYLFFFIYFPRSATIYLSQQEIAGSEYYQVM